MTELVYSGALWVAIPIAIAAGLVSFLSPCVLPLVPGYLGYVSGIASVPESSEPAALRRARRRMLAGVWLFIAGFSTVFVLATALAGVAGVWLRTWQDPLTRVLGLVLIVLGLVFVGAFRPMQRSRKLSFTPKVGLAGAPLLGIVFALGWTPCIGPTLAVVLSLSLSGESAGRGALLGLAYCLGLGIPFVLLALGFSWATRSVSWFKRHIRAVNIAGGALLMVIGVLMLSGLWSVWMFQLQAVIGGYVPAI